MSDSKIKLWSIGGGKGGIGKSVISLGLGISLAHLGKKVILIDGDLGGANLHTLMGVRYPHVTLEHFLLRKVDRLEDTIIQTQLEDIGLICGADDLLGAANPTYSQKIRLLNQIEALPAQYILLDLGAGTAFNLLDFFNYSRERSSSSVPRPPPSKTPTGLSKMPFTARSPGNSPKTKRSLTFFSRRVRKRKMLEASARLTNFWPKSRKRPPANMTTSAAC